VAGASFIALALASMS